MVPALLDPVGVFQPVLAVACPLVPVADFRLVQAVGVQQDPAAACPLVPAGGCQPVQVAACIRVQVEERPLAPVVASRRVPAVAYQTVLTIGGGLTSPPDTLLPPIQTGGQVDQWGQPVGASCGGGSES